MKTENEKEKRKRYDKAYDEANEMNSITVSEGFVTITKHFRYLGRFVSYNLRSNYNVDRRLASTSSSIGALDHFWKDISVNLYRKYWIFLAITINILLWGCKSWALRIPLLNKLGVFVHRSIRNILGVTMTQVKEERITNETIC